MTRPARRPSDRPGAVTPQLIALLTDVLALDAGRAAHFSAQTRLFGSIPELDSMAVATVLTAIEDRFGILIDDEDVSLELFETVGSLAAFVAARQGRPGD